MEVAPFLYGRDRQAAAPAGHGPPRPGWFFCDAVLHGFHGRDRRRGTPLPRPGSVRLLHGCHGRDRRRGAPLPRPGSVRRDRRRGAPLPRTGSVRQGSAEIRYGDREFFTGSVFFLRYDTEILYGCDA